ncbi:MAG TPA: BatA and WFA domain-containing protein [Verrucomicrobiales bacterium]|nr:BatA and WFA domain-containing protein [Verrucomicrobiales bacterium]
MKFLAPLFFWSFLSLIPLVAVYFLKVRPRRKDTTAYFLWRRVFTEKKAASLFNRLRDLLSLILLALVFGSVCLALTRPELQDDERKDLLLLLDNSASMGAGAGSQQRMNLAMNAARDLIKGMDTSQRASVATVSSEVHFLSHLTDDPRQLLDAVDSIKPSVLNFNRDAVAALRAGDSADWMKGHRLILITDGCFGPTGPPEGVEVFKVGEPLENAGIVSADAQFLPGPNNPLGVYVQFASSYKNPVNATLTLKPEGPGAHKLVDVTIAPGLNPGEMFTVQDGTPGKWTASINLNDGFPGDNSVSLVAQKQKPVRVNVDAADKFFFDTAVESFSGGGNGFLFLTSESPQVVIARNKVPDAPLSLIFQPQGTSVWWKSVGEPLETAVPRVRVPDHPVLRHIDAAGMNFAGARKIIPADGALVLVESDQSVPLLYVANAGGRTAVVVNMDPVDAEFFYSAWFPVLVYGAATHLAGREESLASTYTPGATIPLPGAMEGQTTKIIGPDDKLISATGRKFGPLEQPGFYQLRNDSGEWLAAVNLLSPGESLLDNSPTKTTLGPIAKGLPPYLLLTIIAIIVLILESILYHRRKVG